jgi:glycosyltransferase involved in cell wall biosynthesis
MAIKSFSLAFSNNTGINLFFVGAGELLPEANLLVEKSGVKNIHFLGAVPDSGKILASADLLFMPSRYEGLPIAALEAGIYGVPILASPIPELESIGKGMGWLFPEKYSSESFAEALTLAVENIENIKNKSKNNVKKYKEKYGIERCAADYVVQYNFCLNN